MTIGGWIFMLASVSFVLSLAIWCFARLFRTEDEGEDEP